MSYEYRRQDEKYVPDDFREELVAHWTTAGVRPSPELIINADIEFSEAIGVLEASGASEAAITQNREAIVLEGLTAAIDLILNGDIPGDNAAVHIELSWQEGPHGRIID